MLAEGGAWAISRTSPPNDTSQRTVRGVTVRGLRGGRLRGARRAPAWKESVRSAGVRLVGLWPEVGGDAFHVSWGSCPVRPQNFPAHLGKEHLPARTGWRLSGLGRGRPGLGGVGHPLWGGPLRRRV